MGTPSLDTPIQYVQGVGPARAAQLADLGVATLEDLLTYYPRRFDLRRQAQPIGSLRGDEQTATVAGEVIEVEKSRWGRRPWFGCCIQDDSGWVLVKWFNALYLASKITPGTFLAVSGKVGVYKEHVQFVNPSHQVLYDMAGTNLAADELMPVYPASAQLSSGRIALIIKRILPHAAGLIQEWLDGGLLKQRGLMDRPAAVAAMHRPEDTTQWEAARRRLAYDECLLLQLGLAMARASERSRPAHPLRCTELIDQRIRKRFPFTLTAAQDRVVAQIAADLAQGRPMNRLLQGDVGSGKTVVALYAALLAVASLKQAAIMAPTEILARQHHRKIEQYLEGSRVRLALLVGDQTPTVRSRILDGLAGGSIDIVVGTHALLGEQVKFHDLAVVVVDEQHKFGVRQRAGIRGKGFAPHYLVMTATPIPRTLAMTVFGDLDVSVIDDLPPGRGQTTTLIMEQAQMPKVLTLVRQRLEAGQQAYFIYPLVKESDALELKAAEGACRELSAGALGQYGVGMVHGQMPAAAREAALARFRDGRTRVLAASVVVEVGLDIPAANVMVVMHAERFGLAQLHQLRGRIGRSSEDATCILVAGTGTPLARRRLGVLATTGDGFKIAEEDLRLRGPGEMLGTRQHGLPELKVADLAADLELLQRARRDAFAMVSADPMLEAPHHRLLRQAMVKAYKGRIGLVRGG